MTREERNDGTIRLKGNIRDKRNGKIYSDVVCLPENEHNYEDADLDEN